MRRGLNFYNNVRNTETKEHNMIKKFRIMKYLFTLCAVLMVFALGINFYVVKSTEDLIVNKEGTDATIEGTSLNENVREFGADCILVLGAGLKPDGTPNFMLQERLDTALALYKSSAASKLLLSGDHGQMRYDEVNAMKKYAEDAGVPAEDIFLDHAGFSTYDSMYRAAEIFDADRVIVVTQKYHQNRALYIGKKLGMEVIGVSCDRRVYTGQFYREVREIIARDKDFFKVILRPEPTYLGDTIPISGSGLETRD